MKDGFFRTAAATLKGRVADTGYNCREICRIIEEGEREGAGLMVFPELCITSYTCNDLFLQEPLLRRARACLLYTSILKDCLSIRFSWQAASWYLWQSCLPSVMTGLAMILIFRMRER